ncbi:MAG: nitrite/sulfite reductase [Phycisphaeraceae bacterium]|nr:nitrite/sulfite reductase [Phycisphaeraceae bacterium]
MTDQDDDKNLNKVELLKREKDGFDVLKDLLRYSEQGDFDAIEANDLAIRFRWFGVYQQKPNVGHFMLRIKIPGGQLSPAQLRRIGELADRHARGFSDITTRQTIQFHWLTIGDLKPVFDSLAEIGLNSQFACGDTPRNVVSCPLAGVLKDEIIDSSALVREVSAMFEAGGREFSNLPRKFKTSIGGCDIHCHQPQINDIGIFGVKRKDGEVGYGLLVGGGLSRAPHFGQPMRVFLKPGQVPEVCRAIAILFREHGYRKTRTRARLKFLVADEGWEWTRGKIEEILGYSLEHDDSILHPDAIHSDHMGIGEQKDGNFYVGIPIERGRWTARNMIAIADLAERFAGSPDKPARIRLTGKQNVLILDVPKAKVDDLVKELDSAGLPPHAPAVRRSLISCTGTEFCNLAVVETKHRGGRVLRWLEEHTDIDFPLFISFTGCPNACAQFQIADIGLTGTMTKDPAKLDEKGRPAKVEGYNVLLGAGIGANPVFGEVIAKQVIADKIHLSLKSLVDAYRKQRVDEDESFQSWVARSEPEDLRKLILDPTLEPAAEPLLA